MHRNLPPISTTLLPSIARNVAQAYVAEIPRGYSSLQLRIDVTAASATPSVTPVIEAWDDAAQGWAALLTGVAITGTGTTVLTVAEWATDTANVAAKQKAPDKCRLTMTHADTDSITYSVGAWLHE